MIIVKLQGGLGNQMFQYATARGIAYSKSRSCIFFDTSFLIANSISTNFFTARKFELGIFSNIKSKTLSRFFFKIIESDSWALKLFRNLFINEFKFIKQKENEFIPELLNLSSNLYLDGYFQSEKYFIDIREQLLQVFLFPALDKTYYEILKVILSHINSVSIHVRRGDYLKTSAIEYHGILPISYYKKAIRQLENKYPDIHLFIFSDDTEWCKSEFSFLNGISTIIDNNIEGNAWKDMCLMTHCRHHIIANSSYSWWGAWLSTKSGIKMAPKYWFNPTVANYDINDFVPGSWQIIDYD